MKKRIIALLCCIFLLSSSITALAQDVEDSSGQVQDHTEEEVNLEETTPEVIEEEVDIEETTPEVIEEEAIEPSEPSEEAVEETLVEPVLEQEEIKEPKLSYQVHVQNIGWQNSVENGAVAGTTGRALRLEAIKISILDSPYDGAIQYRTHIQDYGWSAFTTDGKTSGTTGQSKRLEAIEIKLTGELADHYDIYYRAHIQQFGWLDWAKNGEPAGSSGLAYRMEAVQIKLVAKNAGFGESTHRPYVSYSAPSMEYRVHGQNYGWQNFVGEGQIAGTVGQSNRLEAIVINVNPGKIAGGIEYSAHVQNVGWQEYVQSSQTAGTQGQSLRMEAIKIRLSGDMANIFDVYYRAHIQNFGWMGWTKNGGIAGSIGASRRMEALQIRLVRKGAAAPSLGKAYAEKSDYSHINKEEVIQTAASFISPAVLPQDNQFTKKWPYPHGGWCQLYIMYCFDVTGNGNAFYNGQYEWSPEVVFRYYQKQGLMRYDTNLKRGDIIFVDWQNDGIIDHAEIVETPGLGNRAHTILSGNLGGRVARALRQNNIISGHITPNY